MRKVFWDDPYQRSLETRIVSLEGNRILLAETIAFSFSGGQESDKATLNGIPILHSEKEGTLIYYTLDPSTLFHTGESVTLKIEWPRRYRLMRLHFAAELILEIVTRKFGLEKVGAHIAEHKARIHFSSNRNLSEGFDAILGEYNAIIHADLPIHTGFSDIKTQRRFWKIDGFAEVPCGGTHVNSTAEVGNVILKRKNIGRGKERMEIRLCTPLVFLLVNNFKSCLHGRIHRTRCHLIDTSWLLGPHGLALREHPCVLKS